MLRLLAIAILGLTTFLVLSPETLSPPDKRILFIGNSFTFGGEVPTQVRNIAITSTPSVNYHVEMVVRGGITLEDHLTETNAIDTLQNGDWDVVVLQDASTMSFSLHWTSRMQRSAAVFAELAQNQGTEVLYYSHWSPRIDYLPENSPIKDTAPAIRRIEQTYEDISTNTGGSVAYAGRVWQMADDAGITALYEADEHHASVKGAYVAALAIAAALGDIDPGTSTWTPKDIPLNEQEQLRAMASTLSVAEHPN